MKITTNAGTLARNYAARIRELDAALKRGLQKAAALVDREQVKRLSGSNTAAPGDYPVPARTGNLLGSHFFHVESSRLAIVGNTAQHAVEIHEGRGNSTAHGRRPFLDDAAEAVDIAEPVMAEARAVMAIEARA